MTRPQSGTIEGTPYFVSRGKAVGYYRDYFSDAEKAVSDKLAAGEIFIGPPPHSKLDRVILVDGGTRYAIEYCHIPVATANQ